MINLPHSTQVNRFIAKEKFYSKTTFTPRLRKLFTDEIERVTWSHKISPETLNITAISYSEMQVFTIILKSDEINQAVIKHIDSFIPYPILFILKKPGSKKAMLAYKEPNQKDLSKMRVDSIYETTWQPEVTLELRGRSVDEIYRQFLYQIAPQLVKIKHHDAKAAIELDKEIQRLHKQIDALNHKIRNELSDAKRHELARERVTLEQQLKNTL